MWWVHVCGVVVVSVVYGLRAKSSISKSKELDMLNLNKCDRCGEEISSNNNDDVTAEIREFTGGVCMSCHRLAWQEEMSEGCEEDAPF